MSKEIKVAELFAGVGGFRLGLDGYSNPKFPDFKMKPAGNFHTVWAGRTPYQAVRMALLRKALRRRKLRQ